MAPPLYRPEALERVQFGVEVTPGTLVAADKQFHSLKFDLNPKKPTQKIMQAGNLYHVNMVPAKGHTELTAKGDASVTDIIYVFSTMIAVPTFATPGGGTDTRTATITPLSQSANAKAAISIEKGQPGAGFAKTIPYVECTDYEMDFVPDKAVTVSAKFMGRQRTAGATLTASPTTLTPALLFPTSQDVYIATTEAGLAAGQIYPLSAKLKFSKFLGDVYSVSSSTSFDTMVEVMPGVEIDLVLPDVADMQALVDSIDTAEQYYIEILSKGNLIEGSLYNQFRFRAPIQFSDPDEGSAQDVHTISLKANCNHVPDFNVTGGAFLIECQSTLAAL